MSSDLVNLAGDLVSAIYSAENAAAPVNSIGAAGYEPRRETAVPGDERIDRLLLVCTAMWQLIKEKTDLTEDDLVNRVAMLDAQDGTADGKMTEKPRPCPKCRRIAGVKQERCLYCGFQLPVDNVFRTI